MAQTPSDKELEDLIVTIAGGPDQTSGTMIQLVLRAIFYVQRNGWEAYCTEMRRRKASWS